MTVDQQPAGGPYVRAAEFAIRRVGEELILVPIRGHVSELSHIFTLSEVAALVWAALESPLTVDQLVGRVVAEFEVGGEQARQDIVDLLDAFEREKLVRREGSAA